MFQYLNMISKIQLGNVSLNHINGFEISESVTEISNTAKITLPRSYVKKGDKSLLDYIRVGDKIVINAGYYHRNTIDMDVEFNGYIRTIETDIPLVIYCEDETYVLRQTNKSLSYKNATLKDVLNDLMPKGTKIDCPEVQLGKIMFDNVSVFRALQQISEDYGLYSRYTQGNLIVNLRDLRKINTTKEHVYVINPKTYEGNLVKNNELKYKRKSDFKLQVIASGVLSNGKKITISSGNKDSEASQLNINYPGITTEKDLKVFADNIYNEYCYDGYTGSITGFGIPRTHAGDSLKIEDKEEPDRNGSYLIEKVTITYDENGGFSRKNELSYKLN